MIRRPQWHFPALMAGMLLLMTACDSGSRQASSPTGSSAPANTEASTTQRTEDAKITPERPVVAETLPYAEVDEQLIYGHFAFPADMVDPLPGVIVIHERWGLDDRTRALADRIAGQGYIVLAVDLYGGATAGDASAARDLMVALVENPEPANSNLMQARQFLSESAKSPSVGVLGWSLGGSWALNAALLMPDSLDAAVIFYGQVTDNEDRLQTLSAPVLGLFGGNDRGVTEDSVAGFEAALESLDKEFELQVYPDAGHAFADPGAPNYNREAAEDAWSRTVEFLGRHLARGN
jgi:carboxymethylenebutenolidase